METTSANISALKKSFEQELESILHYWLTFSVDYADGGFYGELNNDNQVIAGAVKGSVLNARILWSFAAGYNLTQNKQYLEAAQRAFGYIQKYFIDAEFGGIYWSVTAEGSPFDTKKQVYALAFTIYGLSEYYKATADEDALILAKSLYFDIEGHSFDEKKGGYFEAFTRDWKGIDDLRLSAKDANEKKTMNTHLHILEAYTTLFQIWPDPQLGKQIRSLIGNFEDYIVNTADYHLVLFFDENWQVKSDTISYGHDIEASWLLQEAAEALHDEALVYRIKSLAVQIALKTAESQNEDGSLDYEYEPSQQQLIAEKHWWVQAEAIVGFYNAWQISGDAAFLNSAMAVWQFVQKNIIDHDKGEWYWGIYANGNLMPGYGKIGLWKCPYHNSRACIEMVKRLND